MKTILVALVFAAVLPLAAAPSVSYSNDMETAQITLPSGHTAAWIAWDGGSVWHSASQKDADGDGRITVSSGLLGLSWLLADVNTGEWTRGTRSSIATITESPLPAGTLLPDAAGNYSVIVIPESHYGSGLWVRPGVGAWAPTASRMLAFPEGVLNFVEPQLTMAPVGNSPARPSRFERGDVLLLLQDDVALTGVVDAQLDATPNPGVLSMSDTALHFLEGPGKNAFFDVVRSGGTSGTVSIRCCSFSGTAVPGLDYTPPPQQILTFGPGEFYKHVSFPLINDDLYEDPRTIIVRPDQPAGAPLQGLVEATFVIDDDDHRPTPAIADLASTYPEGDVPWTLQVPVTVSGAFRGTFSQYLERWIGNDRSLILVTFNEGETAKSVGVPIPADKLGNRDVTMVLVFGSSRKTISIVDDDPAQLVAHDIPAYQENSSNIASVQIDVKPDPKAPISFVVSTADGTAKAGSDYKAIVAKTVSGMGPSFLIAIDLINDSVVEGRETFYLDISNVTGATIDRTRVSITIEDDDNIEVLINETTVMEGNTGQTSIPIVLRRTGDTKYSQAVTVESRSGTAGPADFVAWTQPILFLANQIQETHTAIVRGDVEDEHDETVEIVVRYGGRIVGRGTLVIRDDDGPPPPPVRRRTSRH